MIWPCNELIVACAVGFQVAVSLSDEGLGLYMAHYNYGTEHGATMRPPMTRMQICGRTFCCLDDIYLACRAARCCHATKATWLSAHDMLARDAARGSIMGVSSNVKWRESLIKGTEVRPEAVVDSNTFTIDDVDWVAV